MAVAPDPRTPAGNTAQVLDEITSANVSGINVISTMFGALADISGAIGGVESLISFLQGNSSDAELENIGQVREALDNLAGWLPIEVGLSRPLRVSYS